MTERLRMKALSILKDVINLGSTMGQRANDAEKYI